MPSCTSAAAALLALLALCARGAGAIYFHVTAGAQRCFLEEMPGQTLFLATYKNPDYRPWGMPDYTDTAVVIRVVDPSGSTVLSRMADVTGKVAFHSTAGGEYQLCFSTNSTRWTADGAPMRFVRGEGQPWGRGGWPGARPVAARGGEAHSSARTLTLTHTHTLRPTARCPARPAARGLEAGRGGGRPGLCRGGQEGAPV